jgi:hypothetical protein
MSGVEHAKELIGEPLVNDLLAQLDGSFNDVNPDQLEQ